MRFFSLHNISIYSKNKRDVAKIRLPNKEEKWMVGGQIFDNLKPPYLKPPSLIIEASIFDNSVATISIVSEP